MKDKRVDTIISLIIPQIIPLIATHYFVDEQSATKMFYKSKTYAALTNQNSGFWHYSPIVLFDIFSNEYENNELIVSCSNDKTIKIWKRIPSL